MLINNWERQLCDEYSEMGIDGIVHCNECPLVYYSDAEHIICKAYAHVDPMGNGIILDNKYNENGLIQHMTKAKKEKLYMLFKNLDDIKFHEVTEAEKGDYEHGWDAGINSAMTIIEGIFNFDRREIL